MRERGTMSEVRSNELETRLSSSSDPVEVDTAVSTPREVRAFHALEEMCGLDVDTMGRFKDRFQFLEWVRVIGFNFYSGFVFVGPMTRIGLATSSLVRYSSMRLPSLMDLGSPSIRS